MKTNMNRTSRLILSATAVAFGLALSAQVRADESLLPPRAQALIPKVIARDTQNEPDLVRSQPTGPAAKIAAQKTTVRAEASQNSAKIKDRPLFTGNNPFRDTRPPQFEVAPVK